MPAASPPSPPTPRPLKTLSLPPRVPAPAEQGRCPPARRPPLPHRPRRRRRRTCCCAACAARPPPPPPPPPRRHREGEGELLRAARPLRSWRCCCRRGRRGRGCDGRLRPLPAHRAAAACGAGPCCGPDLDPDPDPSPPDPQALARAACAPRARARRQQRLAARLWAPGPQTGGGWGQGQLPPTAAPRLRRQLREAEPAQQPPPQAPGRFRPPWPWPAARVRRSRSCRRPQPHAACGAAAGARTPAGCRRR